MKLKKVHLATLSLFVITSCGCSRENDEPDLYGPPPTPIEEDEPIRLLYGVPPREPVRRMETPQETPLPKEELSSEASFTPDANAGDWNYLRSIVPEEI